MVNDSVRKGKKHKERRGKVEEKAKEKQRGSGTRDDRQGRLYRLFAVKSVVSFHASPLPAAARKAAAFPGKAFAG